MSDIKLFKKQLTDDLDFFDFELENGDFIIEEGLDTAITMSILCEKRDETIDVPENRGGWWGNTVQTIEGYEQGSFVWTKYQSAIDNEIIEDIDTFVRDGLQWLIDDQIASDIETEVFVEDNVIKANVDLFRNNAKEQSRFFDLWKFTGD